MVILVDANIIFSCLLKPDGVISNLFRQLSDTNIYLAPEFLKQEIYKHLPRIQKLSGLPASNISKALDILYSRIIFYSVNVIPLAIEHQAGSLLKGDDDKDIPYLSFALFFQCKLWTGDKPLREALEAKGLHICISTQELLGGV